MHCEIPNTALGLVMMVTLQRLGHAVILMQSIKAVTIDNLFIEKLIWSPVESSPSQLAKCAMYDPRFSVGVKDSL